MEQGILNYFTKKLCLSFVLLLAVSVVYAQNQTSAAKPQNTNDDEAVYFPLYNGLTVSVDLYGIGAKVVGGDFLSSEIAVEANLKNRFFPVVEIGYGSTDTWSETGIHYKTSAPYFRIGVNYNTMYKKGNPNFLFVGLRYAFSSFKYDLHSMPVADDVFGGQMNNPTLQDNIWGGSTLFDQRGVKASMGWIEALVGVRAHIYKNLYMGWTVRMKYRKNRSFNEYSNPWYIPGFGKYDTPIMGMTYTIIYKLPL